MSRQATRRLGYWSYPGGGFFVTCARNSQMSYGDITDALTDPVCEDCGEMVQCRCVENDGCTRKADCACQWHQDFRAAYFRLEVGANKIYWSEK